MFAYYASTRLTLVEYDRRIRWWRMKLGPATFTVSANPWSCVMVKQASGAISRVQFKQTVKYILHIQDMDAQLKTFFGVRLNSNREWAMMNQSMPRSEIPPPCSSDERTCR
jgi:hypothetical protein